MKRCVPLEPAAEAVCDQSAVPPLIFQMPPKQGRRALEEAQDAPVYKYPANISSACVNTGMWGSAALTVAGDSVGGNMAIAMALMSEMRHGPRIHKLLWRIKSRSPHLPSGRE